jgi:hypothetical protein
MDMKKQKLNFTILKEEVGYSAFTEVGEYFISTQADSFSELKDNIIEATNLSFEDDGITYTIDEIGFTFDIPSFFDFYKVINAKVLGHRIGMNASLLAQYIGGHKKPSTKQMQKIMSGVHSIGKELSEVELIVK